MVDDLQGTIRNTGTAVYIGDEHTLTLDQRLEQRLEQPPSHDLRPRLRRFELAVLRGLLLSLEDVNLLC